MTLEQFIQSIEDESLPYYINPLLEALWWERHGNWVKAHKIIQEIHSKDSALVHAYLHHREGDTSNANYWYQTAGESAFNGTMEEEWEKLSISLLNN